MNLESQMRGLAASARTAARTLATATGLQRNKALLVLAELLHQSRSEIFEANSRDLEAARAGGLDEARIDRLRITDAGVDSMAGACLHVAALSDPVGEVEGMIKRPNGLLVGRMRIPLGVIAIIY